MKAILVGLGGRAAANPRGARRNGRQGRQRHEDRLHPGLRLLRGWTLPRDPCRRKQRRASQASSEMR